MERCWDSLTALKGYNRQIDFGYVCVDSNSLCLCNRASRCGVMQATRQNVLQDSYKRRVRQECTVDAPFFPA